MNDVHDIAVRLLDKAKDVLTNEPDRAFVSPGEPAFDCEQLSIQVRSVGAGGKFPADKGENFKAYIPHADYRIEVLRCIPTTDDKGRAPSISALTDAAEIHNRDLQELFTGLAALHTAGELLPAGCDLAHFQNATPSQPSGGVLAARVDLRVTL